MQHHPDHSAQPATATVTVDKLVSGGDGLARLADGRVVFVPQTVASGVAAGDVVTGQPVKRKGRLIVDEAVVTALAPTGRTQPFCPHAADCGGCDWQHLDVLTQHQWKKAIIAENLKRLAGLEDIPIGETITSKSTPNGQHYRYSVTWQVDPDTAKLAYYQRQSHTPMVFNKCEVLAKPLQAVATFLNEQPQIFTHVRRVKARTNREGEVLIGFECGAGVNLPAVNHLLTEPIVGLGMITKKGYRHLAGETTISETWQGREFTFGVSHFMQASPDVLENVLAHIQYWMETHFSSATNLADLYCGIGVLGLAVLQPHQNLVGVEGNAAATGMATHNAQQQGLAGQASFVATSVDKWVAGDGAHQQVDVAIVDPPRAGLGKGVSERLATVPSQGVIYLSCDPATMSRDIKYLTASGLTLKTIMPVDFFPHTHHVEALALLVRN